MGMELKLKEMELNKRMRTAKGNLCSHHSTALLCKLSLFASPSPACVATALLEDHRSCLSSRPPSSLTTRDRSRSTATAENSGAQAATAMAAAANAGGVARATTAIQAQASTLRSTAPPVQIRQGRTLQQLVEAGQTRCNSNQPSERADPAHTHRLSISLVLLSTSSAVHRLYIVLQWRDRTSGSIRKWKRSAQRERGGADSEVHRECIR